MLLAACVLFLVFPVVQDPDHSSSLDRTAPFLDTDASLRVDIQWPGVYTDTASWFSYSGICCLVRLQAHPQSQPVSISFVTPAHFRDSVWSVAECSWFWWPHDTTHSFPLQNPPNTLALAQGQLVVRVGFKLRTYQFQNMLCHLWFDN